jgi:RNA polymerase sigma-70 factor (ECF subfamily)
VTKQRKISFDVQGLKQGRKGEFEALYFEIFDTLYFLALSYVKEKEIAEDLVQDSFMQLWSNRQNLNDDTHVINYLYTLTKNSCLNYIKHLEVKTRYIHNTTISELKFLQHSLNSLPESYSDLMAIKQDLEKAIDSLPEDLKEIFRLNRFSDMTYERIAKDKAISIKTVEAKMSKAIKILRIALREYYPLIVFFQLMNKF